MKKFRKNSAILGLSIVMAAGLIAGCGSDTKEVQTSEVETSETKPAETTTKVVETTTDDMKKGYNPLTGEKTELDISENRPFCVMLNSIEQALPQTGNSEADILIEVMEEGGITRVLGVFQDVTKVGEIGPVRSTREYFLSWNLAFDGILCHAGGDPWVLNKIKTEPYYTMDFLGYSGINAAAAYWRDADRRARVGNEHSLLTSGEKLSGVCENTKIPMKHENDDYTHLKFEENSTPKGEDAESVKVNFSGYKSTIFDYNKTSGNYDITFFYSGKREVKYIDCGNDDKQVDVKNILILPVKHWGERDPNGNYRQKYDMSGGTGYYVSEGKYTEITWEKGDFEKGPEDYAKPLVLKDKDGKELKLNPGKTYICVPSDEFTTEFDFRNKAEQ